MELTFESVDLAIDPSPAVAPVETEDSANSHSNASAVAIVEKVISISREFLSNGALSSLDTICRLQAVEADLTAVFQTSQSSDSLLPNKKEIPPNQHSWIKTTQQMGVQ